MKRVGAMVNVYHKVTNEFAHTLHMEPHYYIRATTISDGDIDKLATDFKNWMEHCLTSTPIALDTKYILTSNGMAFYSTARINSNVYTEKYYSCNNLNDIQIKRTGFPPKIEFQTIPEGQTIMQTLTRPSGTLKETLKQFLKDLGVPISGPVAILQGRVTKVLNIINTPNYLEENRIVDLSLQPPPHKRSRGCTLCTRCGDIKSNDIKNYHVCPIIVTENWNKRREDIRRAHMTLFENSQP